MKLLECDRSVLKEVHGVKRRCLTLVEILVVVSLISIVGGLFAFSLRSAWVRSLANKEMGQLRQMLEVAQAASVFSAIGSKIVFEEQQNAIRVFFQPDFSLDANLVKVKELTLTQVHLLSFLPDSQELTVEGLQELTFLPDGTIKEGDGWLQLSSSVNGEPGLSTYIRISMHTLPTVVSKSPENYRGDLFSAEQIYHIVEGAIR